MKLLSICLLAAAFLIFLSGCVTEVESRRSSVVDEKADSALKIRR